MSEKTLVGAAVRLLLPPGLSLLGEPGWSQDLGVLESGMCRGRVVGCACVLYMVCACEHGVYGVCRVLCVCGAHGA